MTRRRFVVLLASLVGVFALAGTLALEPVLRYLIARAVRRRLPSLRHTPESLGRFASDYLSLREPGFVDHVRLAWELRSGTSPRLAHRYLLSTDFFVNKADESRPIGYRSFYDPYVHPCYAPFPRETERDADGNPLFEA
jgi:hypothetical protein